MRTDAASNRHAVIMPSYNTGAKLRQTVRETLEFWQPLWVVIDGSTDGSEEDLVSGVGQDGALRLICLPANQGKGAAVLAGMLAARDAGYEYALVMDADGQHPAACIPEFMEVSREHPGAMILGMPQFGSDAPAARRFARRVGNWWTNFETLWGGIGDSLFGFRVYPIPDSLAILQNTAHARRYGFDTELAVRLYWRGVRPINVAVPVRYYSRDEGGVSHFHYVRDNVRLTGTHARLVSGMLKRLPKLIALSHNCRMLKRAGLL